MVCFSGMEPKTNPKAMEKRKLPDHLSLHLESESHFCVETGITGTCYSDFEQHNFILYRQNQ